MAFFRPEVTCLKLDSVVRGDVWSDLSRLFDVEFKNDL